MTIVQLATTIKESKIESKKFKEFILNKYDGTFTNKTNVNKIIDWYFKTYDFYIQNLYLECNKKLSNITVKGKHYVNVKIYHNNKSNLKYYKLLIGNKYIKDFKTLKEANLELNNQSNNKLFKLPKNTYSNKRENSTNRLFKTQDNWYGNYKLSYSPACSGSIYNHNSNIGISSIHLGGNDDYSITQDFWSYKEAKKTWNKLCKKKFVNKKDLPNSYYSD